MDQVGALEVGPGPIVAERSHARGDQLREAGIQGSPVQAQRRVQRTAGRVEQDVRASKQAQQRVRDADAEVAAAQELAEEATREGRDAARAEAEQLLATARTQAEKILSEARAEAEDARTAEPEPEREAQRVGADAD